MIQVSVGETSALWFSRQPESHYSSASTSATMQAHNDQYTCMNFG